WTLTGGLSPGHTFALGDLVASLLKNVVAVPPNVPSLTFDTVQASVVPGKTMTFTAGSKTPWRLLEKVTLDAFTLTFAYTRGATQPFTGSLTSALTIAGVDVAIDAALSASGAWSFEGRTKPGDATDVGTLITDLETRFGVPALPSDALNSLELQDLDVRFGAGASAGPPSSFHFGCTGKLHVADDHFTATVAVDLTHGASGYTGAFTGTLEVARGDATTETFSFSIDSAGAMRSHWQAAGPDNGLSFGDVAAAFGFDVPAGIPPEVDPTLTDVVLDYDFGSGALLLQVKTASGGGAVLVSCMSTDDPPVRLWAFGLELHLGITLGDLPLVGDKLGDAHQLGIPVLGLWVTSKPLVTAEAELLNRTFGGFTPAVPESDATSRVSAFGTLSLGAETFPLQFSLGGGDATPQGRAASPAPAPALPPAPGAVPGAPAASGSMKWIDLQRQIGVVQFKRIGAGYSSGQLTFALDVAMTMGPLGISLDGLAITSGLDAFDPSFHLDGLGLAYSEGPVTISGALLRLPSEELAPGTSWQFDGTVVLTAGAFSLAAIGSYAQLTTGQPSLFVFAQVEEPLGGPPAAFVTGLMAGVGFNRSLTIPAQDEVTAFPLLALNEPPAPGQPRPTRAPGDVLTALERSRGGGKPAWIAPEPGAYWLAVGVEFTSFEIVKTKALLVVEDADGFQLSLLGLSTMQLPRPGDPGPAYAYVQLQLLAVLRPDEGYFGLTAILASSSYVIDPACHLHGGFAFFVWFDPNPNAGQFVLTLGGYHPAFKPPDYFPQVPRLGFDWAVADNLTISGDAYFALTTTCVMVGGELDVLFHDGDLQAWLTARADMLVSWNPFFYLADIDISIGVSYRLNLLFTHTTISLSVGASLKLWGPPTAGTVTVHLWCVSFTVAFGSGSPDAATQPLPWVSKTDADFKSLLPAASDVVKVTAVAGLAGTLPADPGGSKKWVVRARDFRFATQSAVPASHLRYGSAPAEAPGTPSVDYDAATGLDIRPMGKSGLTSVHRLNIRRGSSTADPVPAAGWTLVPWTQNVPQALWGPPPDPFTHVPAAPGADVVKDQVSGYAVTAPRPSVGATPGQVGIATISEEYLPAGMLPLDPTAAPSAAYLAKPAATTVGSIAGIGGDAVRGLRNAVFTALGAAGVYSGANDEMTSLGKAAETSFTDSPMQPVGPGAAP
ncbi:MAG: hypothetical protein M3271_04140, partial [Actinomycetota bacterium]|nr:hypothetical protein [Actinomycetota bacterium]